jgi:hypothetical protein
MNINDFYNEVARKADTDKTAIGVVETRRVLSEAFKILAAMPTEQVFDIVGKCIANAANKLSHAAEHTHPAEHAADHSHPVDHSHPAEQPSVHSHPADHSHPA